MAQAALLALSQDYTALALLKAQELQHVNAMAANLNAIAAQPAPAWAAPLLQLPQAVQALTANVQALTVNMQGLTANVQNLTVDVALIRQELQSSIAREALQKQHASARSKNARNWKADNCDLIALQTMPLVPALVPGQAFDHAPILGPAPAAFPATKRDIGLLQTPQIRNLMQAYNAWDLPDDALAVDARQRLSVLVGCPE